MFITSVSCVVLEVDLSHLLLHKMTWYLSVNSPEIIFSIFRLSTTLSLTVTRKIIRVN